jgi:hypothetical protein
VQQGYDLYSISNRGLNHVLVRIRRELREEHELKKTIVAFGFDGAGNGEKIRESRCRSTACDPSLALT